MARQKGWRSASRAVRWTWHSRPLSIPALERGTLADRAADAIRSRVVRGAVAAGQRLESLRELAAEIGVSMAVVREAVSRLKGEGLLEVRPGVGTFVAARPFAARTLKAVRLRAARAEVAELRETVDPAVARIAASRAAEYDIGELHFALGELIVARSAGNPDAFTRADAAFHLAVAKAARNGIGVGFQRMGQRILQPNFAARVRELARSHELADLHQELFDAIDVGRPRLAERAARAIAAIEGRPP